MTMRRSLYVFTLVLLGSAWLPLASAQATTSGGTSTPPLIAIANAGDFAAKVGSLTAPWVDPEFGGNYWGAVASDPTNGPLIAVVDDELGNVWAKEGSLTGGVGGGIRPATADGQWPSRVTPRTVPSSPC